MLIIFGQPPGGLRPTCAAPGLAETHKKSSASSRVILRLASHHRLKSADSNRAASVLAGGRDVAARTLHAGVALLTGGRSCGQISTASSGLSGWHLSTEESRTRGGNAGIAAGTAAASAKARQGD